MLLDYFRVSKSKAGQKRKKRIKRKKLISNSTASYIDYADKSKYFNNRDKVLREDIDKIEKYKKYTVWVQEFSKKIVVIAFVMYIISTLFSLYIIYISFMTGNASGVDTLISETNQTFREVIGGYIIKSAIENSFKIAGNYFIGICDARLKVLKHNVLKENNIEDDEDIEIVDSNYPTNIFDNVDGDYDI